VALVKSWPRNILFSFCFEKKHNIGPRQCFWEIYFSWRIKKGANIVFAQRHVCRDRKNKGKMSSSQKVIKSATVTTHVERR
jgi:hypothetical protein